MTNTPIKAQAWTCTSPGFPNGNAGCGAPGTATWLGYVGIRTNVPAKPLHIYSGFCAEPAAYDPAVARLQTNAANYGFGQSSIQFWSGGLGIQDWHVGAIKPITGVNPYSAFPSIFNTANPLSPANWKGGLAFFCSGTGQQPTEFNDIEVMRVVDDKVGIRTKDPLGQLDVNVGDAAAKPKVSIINGTTPHLEDTYGGPQLRFYIPNDNIDSPPDRSSSYSWYIHAMRQYNPACFLGLDGTRGLTGENTTLSALHFMAGYNTASHAAGDIYRDNKGSETAIPRMSLLSNGNVGINSMIPMVRFNVYNGSVLFDGEQGSTPMKRGINAISLQYEQQEIGAGTRLMWIPDKAAFRAGIIDGYNEGLGTGDSRESDPDYDPGLVPIFPYINLLNKTSGWNTNKIGMYSTVIGRNSRAQGNNDIAMGLNNVANSGIRHGAIALGHANVSTGEDAVCIGYINKASGSNSTAIGMRSTVSGENSIALGLDNNSTNISSIVIGRESSATAIESFAFGRRVNATNYNSFCIGAGMTNSKASSLKIGFEYLGNTSTPPTVFVDADGVALGSETVKNKLDVNGSVSIGWGTGVVVLPDNSLCVKEKVGIGDDLPQNSLDVNGSVAIGFGTGATGVFANSLAVAGRIGIGTNSTTGCDLGVNGTACIGWLGTHNVPVAPTTGTDGIAGHPVSMIVENTVIIHGETTTSGTTTTISPAYVRDATKTPMYGSTNGGSYLQVWGEAIKFTTNSNWDVPSDARYKKEVHSFDDGLKLLKQVNPVRFKFNEKLGASGTEEGIGIIAQDIQKIFPYTVHENELIRSILTKEEKRYQVDDQDTIIKRVIDYSKEDNSQPDTLAEYEKHHEYKDTTVYEPIKRWVIEPAEYRTDSMPLLTYNSSALTYVIINSIKEIDSLRTADKQELIGKIILQNEVIHSQNSTIDSLILANKNFEERIARLETKNEISLNEVSDVILEQNNPNPFSENTTITYFIPDKVQGNAELVIAPAASQSPTLQKFPLTKGTPTQLIISAKDLYTGVFVYSITVNGTVLASKKFIIIK